jgi:hypothetical protein
MRAQEGTTGPNWTAGAAALLGVEAGWWAFNASVFAFGGDIGIALIPVALAGLCILSAILSVRSHRSGFWLGFLLQAPALLQGVVLLNSYTPLFGVFAIILGMAGMALLVLGRTLRRAR